MSTFLLLVGLALFISGAAMYLAHAARHDPRWVAGSIFMPVVVPLYYRHHWDELRAAGLVQAAGLVMTLAGVFMMLFQSVQPDSLVVGRHGEAFSTTLDHQNSGFVDSERALKLLGRQGPGRQVAGRVHGEAFRPDRVELVDGVLRLREGDGFFPSREIAIVLGDAIGPTSHIRRVIDPQMPGAPEVHLSWIDSDGHPATEIIRAGYRLSLEVAPGARNKLNGYIEITLPDRRESYAAGDLDVVTSHLRYKGTEVDRHYDHEDTVHYIAEEYLHTQYAEADIDSISFSDTVLDTLEGRADMVATVTLKDGRVGHHIVKTIRNELGWSVQMPESAAATEAAGYRPVYNVMPPEALVRHEAPSEKIARAAPPARKVVEKTLSFAQLGSLTGQGAMVEFRDGRREQGILRGVQKDRLVVEAMKGGGVVEFRVADGELSLLRMNNGDIVHIAGVSPQSSASAPVASTAPVSAAASAPVSINGMDLGRYMNKMVRVVTNDGKATVGVLRGVNKESLVIETMVGGGKVDYNIAGTQLKSIDFAGR